MRKHGGEVALKSDRQDRSQGENPLKILSQWGKSRQVTSHDSETLEKASETETVLKLKMADLPADQKCNITYLKVPCLLKVLRAHARDKLLCLLETVGPKCDTFLIFSTRNGFCVAFQITSCHSRERRINQGNVNVKELQSQIVLLLLGTFLFPLCYSRKHSMHSRHIYYNKYALWCHQLPFHLIKPSWSHTHSLLLEI